MDRPVMNFVKKVLKLSALTAFSFLVGVLLCEVLVRVAAPQRLDTWLDLYDPDPDLVFKMRPNYNGVYSNFEFTVPIEINSLGLRDKEIAPKPKGTYRILGLGDSFSFANGVFNDDTYFKQLERCLSTRAARAVEVINCAVPANSLVQELRFLKKYGPVLDPDAVLVGFYVGNDFVDSYELFNEHGIPLIGVRDHFLYTLKASDEENNLIRRLTFPMRFFLAQNSHLYIFLRNRSSEFLSRMGLRAPVPPPEFCSKVYSPNMQKAWEVTMQILRELSAYTRAGGIDLYVAILPTVYQVNTESWDQYEATRKIDSNLYDLDKPQRLLTEFCAQHNIECIDVLAMMRRVGKEEPLFYQVDSHMNVAGHRAVADSLCGYLATQPGDTHRRELPERLSIGAMY